MGMPTTPAAITEASASTGTGSAERQDRQAVPVEQAREIGEILFAKLAQGKVVTERASKPIAEDAAKGQPDDRDREPKRAAEKRAKSGDDHGRGDRQHHVGGKEKSAGSRHGKFRPVVSHDAQRPGFKLGAEEKKRDDHERDKHGDESKIFEGSHR